MTRLPDMPYFDFVFEELERGENKTLETIFGKHVHWGYWPDPRSASLSLEDLSIATDALTWELTRELELANGQHILDAGCGFGGTTSLLNSKYNNITVRGINIDPRQVERANRVVLPQKQEQNDIQFLVGNACELPFEDNSFDNALAVECIFHFPSRKKFFSEVSRVLKPGARLVLSDFVTAWMTLPFLAVVGGLHGRAIRQTFGEARMILDGSYERIAKATGFKLLSNRDVTKETLPTYDALEKYGKEMNVPPKTFFRANHAMRLISRAGWLKYRILAFEKL